MELSDRVLSFLIANHSDEREAARFTGELVLNQQDLADSARLREVVLQIGLGGIEGQISHVEFVAHLIVI